MLRPTKHADPSKTVLAAASLLLKHLNRHRVESFDKLREVLQQKDPQLDPLFVPALNLLYALGLLHYRSASDSFEYTPKKAVAGSKTGAVIPG